MNEEEKEKEIDLNEILENGIKINYKDQEITIYFRKPTYGELNEFRKKFTKSKVTTKGRGVGLEMDVDIFGMMIEAMVKLCKKIEPEGVVNNVRKMLDEIDADEGAKLERVVMLLVPLMG